MGLKLLVGCGPLENSGELARLAGKRVVRFLRVSGVRREQTARRCASTSASAPILILSLRLVTSLQIDTFLAHSW
jgi:hypothetical protein